MNESHSDSLKNISGEKATPVQIIEPTGGTFLDFLKELWRYRELYLFLTWRDIVVKYKQTIFGVLWVVFQPAIYMLIFTVVFHLMVGVKTTDVPYPLFVLSAIIPWTFFSSSITRATESLVNSRDLLTKVYFPRVFIPLASATTGLLDAFIAFIFLALVMIFYKFTPSVNILFLPLMIIFVLATTMGISLIFSALNVKYRDIKFVTNYLMQIWMYITPVFYPLDVVPEKYRFVAFLNPMTGVVEGFRFCLVGSPFPVEMMAYSVTFTVVLLAVGQWYFRRMELTFADIV